MAGSMVHLPLGFDVVPSIFAQELVLAVWRHFRSGATELEEVGCD